MAAGFAGAALLALYSATLAPSVTFWDAGELIAAARVFGIPHPPGTPLYVAIAHAWSECLPFLRTARATNLLSACCTAGAGAALALLVARLTRSTLGAVAAAICAGGMSTVWLNATETEVYGASLLLSMLALVAADQAGRTGSMRWLALTSYALALAVPLHLSALVVAPGALLLAAQDERGWIRWSRGLLLSGGALLAIAIGFDAVGLAALSLALLLVVVAMRRERRWSALAIPAVVLLAITAIAILRIRALHDPPLNEGNARDWTSLLGIVGREQYGGLPLFPRQAPLWLQLLNVGEYVDWQVALGLAPGVTPSPARAVMTVLFLVLAAWGSLEHRRADRRSWRAFVAVLIAASVGLVLVLNFKAGASIGYGLFGSEPAHEVRERDYFFTLAFWMWGAWAGFGAVRLAQRGDPRLARGGLALAALPILLNWRAVDRRLEPSQARRLAIAVLWSAPPRALLVSGGDNDTFPLWYLQVVEEVRPDVTIVVAPLLAAPWYREQLRRRDRVLERMPADARSDLPSLLQSIVRTAKSQRRPFATTLPAGSALRQAIGGRWLSRGLIFVRVDDDASPWSAVLGGSVDTVAARDFSARFTPRSDGWLERLAALPPGSRTDPSDRLAARWLLCPRWALEALGGSVRADSLASMCNLQ